MTSSPVRSFQMIHSLGVNRHVFLSLRTPLRPKPIFRRIVKLLWIRSDRLEAQSELQGWLFALSFCNLPRPSRHPSHLHTTHSRWNSSFASSSVLYQLPKLTEQFIITAASYQTTSVMTVDPFSIAQTIWISPTRYMETFA